MRMRLRSITSTKTEVSINLASSRTNRESTFRIAVKQHLGKILQRRFAFWKCDLPDAIENFPVPLWRFRNTESFRDRGNLAVMPADQNDLTCKRQVVEDGVGHPCDVRILVRKAIVDRQIQSDRQLRNCLD